MTPKLRPLGLRWQANYYDHVLRSSEALEPVARYMWLNPYRAGLVRDTDVWPGWWCRGEVEAWLGDGVMDVPPPSWWG